MTSFRADIDLDTDIVTTRSPVPAESGLLDPEVPALARARRRAAERRLADFGTSPQRPAAAAVVIHITGNDVLPDNA